LLSPQAIIKKVTPKLSLITLVPPIIGFEDFIGVWLYQGETTFIVDVGPSSTANALLDILYQHEIENLDYILLTHIHLDHAGGIGAVTERFSKTPIVCHATGISHLVDPTRLWEGTLKTLGSIGEAYGPIQPVPKDRLIDSAAFISHEFKSIDTPGHAQHHVSYRFGDILFTGEAGGVIFQFEKGRPYLRPSTPPKLLLKTFLASIDRLISENPLILCPAHHGFYDKATELLKVHRNQLEQWAKVIREAILRERGSDLITVCLARLLQQDPLLKSLRFASDTIQKRERFFLANSIRGFLGDLKQSG
jgi:glyoxylase-like metal-dependent hydrolase (beta-lactamase superfamily II)